MTSSIAVNPAPVLDVDQLASHVGEGLRRHAPQNVSRWFRRLVSVGSCSRPVRLKGSSVVQDVMGRELSRFSSTDEPDGVLLKACGDRRASRCPGCAYTYRGDAWQLIAAGLRSGKGVPQSAAGHPRVFLTVTAPSFGPVHTRRVNSAGVALRCHNGRPGQTCPHGRPTRCLSRHRDDDDPRLSQPLCNDCYDHDGQVLFNALATELWRRTTVYLTRALAAQVGMPYRRMLDVVRIRYVKVAEYQARGVVHFHAIVRLDGLPADQSSDVAPPPPQFTAAALARAATDAAAKVRVPVPEAVRGQHGDTFGWGRQLDVHEITHTPEGEAEGSGELTEGQVAAYISKYATKSTETCGGADRPIRSERAIDHANTTPHVKALMRACWRLGGTDGLQQLRLRDWTHMLGFRGHFTTKSPAYSTTFTALRRARHQHARHDHTSEESEPSRV